MNAILTAVQLATTISASQYNFGGPVDSELPISKSPSQDSPNVPITIKFNGLGGTNVENVKAVDGDE